ncbi:PAS domain S-box protein [Alteromonas sediminis]|uniref:histidine kinase n=1 Tax=Alteromonas sediminis TaxID=2259342 RepID=A0A3N5Y5P0_9ALTE|nr:PAS domain-containing protein [Alteromonas sediminis]RPJ68573.1 PAS domain S-box protein [Alteromonas sediminis]
MSEHSEILENLNTLVIKASKEAKFLYANTYWEELLGIPLQHIKQVPFYELIHPADIKATEEAFAAVLVHGQPVIGFRNRYRKSTGDYVWLEWTARLDSEGDVVASAIPCDEKVALEEHDKKASTLLRQSEGMAKVGHWSVEFESGELFWSDEIYRIHGVTKQNYTPTVDSAIAFYHPEDAPRVSQLVSEALTKQSEWEFTLRIIRADGEIRHVRSQAKISRNSSGEPTSVFGIFQDITEFIKLNRQIQKLSKVAQTPATGVVICNKQKEVEWVNQAFTKITGYSIDDVAGMNLARVLHGDKTDQNTVEKIRNGLAKDENIDVEIINYHKSGKPYWNNLIISPLVENGETTHYIGFQNDITEKKTREEELLNAQKVSLAGQMAASICHDFNNILSILGASVELISLKDKEGQYAKLLSKASNAVNRGQSITQKLLKTTKISSPSLEIFKLDDFLRQEASLYEDVIPSSIDLQVDCMADLYVECDKNAFADVALNLIINAHKAISASGKIAVKTRHERHFNALKTYTFCKPKVAEDYLVFSVSDSGKGIAQSELNNIFMPFYTLREDHSGHGLGLSSVAAFCDKHGCGITVESELDKGSTFSIWFPKAKEQKKKTKPRHAKPSTSLSGVRILFVDDERDLVALNKASLESQGAIVYDFCDPQEALSFAQSNADNIDIIVSDQTMRGGIQGNELIDLIKRVRSDIPAIIITGVSSASALSDCQYPILQKPVSATTLKHAITDNIGSV